MRNHEMAKAFAIRLNGDKTVRGKLKEKQALIVYGGEGHNPKEVAEILAGLLKKEHFQVRLSDTLDAFLDAEKRIDLIVLVWTRGTITERQLGALLERVKSGVGFVGIHAAIGAFRPEIEFHHMLGGQFVDHPGGADVTYRVHMTDKLHAVTRGIEDFTVTTEKYYMLLDPAIHVLAATFFAERNVSMPVAWTKTYGEGKVFYCSLGHTLDIFKLPQVLLLMKRGMVWASN